MRSPEGERPRAFALLHLAEGSGLSANDSAHLVCFYSTDRRDRCYVRVNDDQLAELRSLAQTHGIAQYERVDMRVDCGIDMAGPIHKVEADIERGPLLVQRRDASTPTAVAAAASPTSAAAAASSSESSSLFLYSHGVLLPLSLVQGLIWYRNPTGPQSWDPELRFVQDCERTPAQIEAHVPEQNFAHRLKLAIPGHNAEAHHMRSAVLDLRFASTAAGNSDGSASSVSSSSSAAASFTKQQRDAVSTYLASHLPASFSILKLNVTIAQLKSMEREADEEAPRVPTRHAAPSYGVCEHHRSKQPVPFIQVKSAEEGFTPLPSSSQSTSSSSEMAMGGFAPTPPLSQATGSSSTVMSPMTGATPMRVTPLGSALPMHPGIMHPMAVGHPGMQMLGPMGPQQQQAQAYAMMQQQQQQQQQAQGQLVGAMNPAMHMGGMNSPQMHPAHMPPASMQALQAQLMAQQLNMHHQASMHSAQSVAAAHLHHQQQRQQAAAFAAANHPQMLGAHPSASLPPHMLPHPMQMQMHMPYPVPHMMQQQPTLQLQPPQQPLPQQPQLPSPTLLPTQPKQQLQPAPSVARSMPSLSPPAKALAAAKPVLAKPVVVAEPASPQSPVLAPRAAAAAASSASAPASPPSSVSALAPPLPALRNGLTLTERTVYAGRLMACQGCHAVKSSCDAERPCFRCVRMGRQCIQREKARQRKTSKPARPRSANSAESRQIFAEHRAAAALLMANSNPADGAVVSDDSGEDSEAD